MKEAVRLWLERAGYDWETASAMLNSGRYLYVAFMCQQAVEKMLKGFVHHKTGKLPPHTHNLAALAELANIHFSEGQHDFLALLTRYYLNTRYPDYKQKMAAELNKEKANELMEKTKGILKCLKKELGI